MATSREGMRWDCQSDGCFLGKKIVRLFDFDDCFGGKIGFTDIDGLVERNGHFLFTEWKAEGEALPVGQRILFEQLTKASDRIIVVVVNGESGQAKESSPKQYTTIYMGDMKEPVQVNIQQIKAFFRRWYEWADQQERL